MKFDELKTSLINQLTGWITHAQAMHAEEFRMVTLRNVHQLVTEARTTDELREAVNRAQPGLMQRLMTQSINDWEAQQEVIRAATFKM